MDALSAACSGLHTIKVSDDVGAARRLVRRLALAQGADDAACGRAELATTELGTNLLHYARGTGYLLLQPLALPSGHGIEILAVDRGGGIENLGTALAGTSGRWPEPGVAPRAPEGGCGLGCGLAGVQRAASEFDVYTVPGKGTVVLARFVFDPPATRPALRWGGVSVPLSGETENGDAWAISLHEEGFSVLAADGLGHGPLAARASEAAVASFRRTLAGDLEGFFGDAHAALRATRGAAVSVARVSTLRGQLRFIGLGNVEGRVFFGGGSSGLTPRPGTLGMNHQTPKLQAATIDWPVGAMLIMHTDGIRQHFDLGALGGDLPLRDPSVIAAVLHRDYSRGRDDATVVVVRDLRDAP